MADPKGKQHALDTDVDVQQLTRQLEDANDQIAQLRVELWELRDNIIGSSAHERSVEFLLRENDHLRYLVRRPWRVAEIGAKHFAEKASRRIVSKRANMGTD